MSREIWRYCFSDIAWILRAVHRPLVKSCPLTFFLELTPYLSIALRFLASWKIGGTFSKSEKTLCDFSFSI